MSSLIEKHSLQNGTKSSFGCWMIDQSVAEVICHSGASICVTLVHSSWTRCLFQIHQIRADDPQGWLQILQGPICTFNGTSVGVVAEEVSSS